MPKYREFRRMEIVVNHSKKFEIVDQGAGNLLLNGEERNIDLIPINDHTYHLIKDHQCWVLEISVEESTALETVLYVNGVRMTTHIKDSLEKVLENMGMTAGNLKVKELKSPMPGMVIKVMVEAGQEVKKDDPMLVLEAMKMENLIKSPTDGIIDKVVVQSGDKTEKNQVLIHFV